MISKLMLDIAVILKPQAWESSRFCLLGYSNKLDPQKLRFEDDEENKGDVSPPHGGGQWRGKFINPLTFTKPPPVSVAHFIRTVTPPPS